MNEEIKKLEEITNELMKISKAKDVIIDGLILSVSNYREGRIQQAEETIKDVMGDLDDLVRERKG